MKPQAMEPPASEVCPAAADGARDGSRTLKILMVCYYYPPLVDVGSKRSVAFSKYFKKHGWLPWVLSVKNPDRHYCLVGQDAPPEGIPTRYSYSIVNVSWIFGKLNGALARLLKLVGIRVAGNVFHDLFCYPDRFLGWVPLTTLAAARMVRVLGIDVIYVSCSPFSSALVGVLLKKITKRALVLDFRDPYLASVASHVAMSRIRARIEGWFERRFVRNADVFLVTSEETRAQYLKTYPEIATKTFTIYNGFDPPVAANDLVGKFEKFTIIYTGQFYIFGPTRAVQNDQFFGALEQLKSAGDISAENFQFIFFGDEYRFIADTAQAYGVSDLVFARPRVAYGEVLQSVRRSHLMLLRTIRLRISTKLFEGIPLNVPFLATIPHGESEDLIKRYSPGSYVIAEEGSHLDVAEAVRDAMARWRRNEMPANHVEEFLAHFTREKLAQKVMRIVESRLRSACGSEGPSQGRGGGCPTDENGEHPSVSGCHGGR